MPNLEYLIETGAESQISVLFPGGTPYLLLTAKDFDTADKVGVETVFAVGNSTAIALKKNNYEYSGSFTLQSGEVAALCAALGVKSLVQGAELDSIMRFGINVQFVEQYVNVYIASQDTTVGSQAKETPVKIAFMARTKQ